VLDIGIVADIQHTYRAWTEFSLRS